MAYKLSYLDIRGRAEPLRLLFALAGQDYEDHRFSYEEFPKLKPGFPWGQAPVLQVGDKTIAQTATIARFLARRFKLQGGDEFAVTKCEELVDAMNDLATEWAMFYYVEQNPTKKAEMKKKLLDETLPKYLGKFEKIKADNGGDYIVGPSVTWADVWISNMLETFENTIEPSVLDKYANLKKMKASFFAIPNIKAYVAKRPAGVN